MLKAVAAGGLPEPVFVHRASVEAADEFFASRAPDHRAIADPDGRLFAAFGLQKGSLWQLLGPAVWWRGLVALFKGNFVGRPTGNETQMPGAFVVRGREVLFSHRADHAGDHPDFDAMRRALDPDAANGPVAKGASKETKALEAKYRELLEEARHQQRNGDLRAFAALTAQADEVARQLDALEEQRA